MTIGIRLLGVALAVGAGTLFRYMCESLWNHDIPETGGPLICGLIFLGIAIGLVLIED